MYRMNYGNGQVSRTFRTKTEAEREIAEQRAYDLRHSQSSQGLRLEKYDGDGEWVRVKEKAQ